MRPAESWDLGFVVVGIIPAGGLGFRVRIGFGGFMLGTII